MLLSTSVKSELKADSSDLFRIGKTSPSNDLTITVVLRFLCVGADVGNSVGLPVGALVVGARVGADVGHAVVARLTACVQPCVPTLAKFLHFSTHASLECAFAVSSNRSPEHVFPPMFSFVKSTIASPLHAKPRRHSKHVVLPDVLEYEPGGHAWHLGARLVLEKVPGSQRLQRKSLFEGIHTRVRFEFEVLEVPSASVHMAYDSEFLDELVYPALQTMTAISFLRGDVTVASRSYGLTSCDVRPSSDAIARGPLVGHDSATHIG